jgi:hypothetical protein
MQRRSFGRRINAWLDEPDGEQFADGKWRFWLPAVLGFSILNAALTVLIFRETASANYLTPALLAASAIVGWIAIGCLHYSDAKHGRMASGVSALDSATLLFVIGHFCFVVYILGHSWILRGAEADYKAALEKHNATALEMQTGNEKITEALRQAADAQKERAKIEQDTAYQYRQAAKHGAKIKTERGGGITANIELAKVELAPPPKAPEDSQAGFLTRWDALVRITNFGELILAAITLIFIRNWTAKSNAPARRDDDEFPAEIDASSRSGRNQSNLRSDADNTTIATQSDTERRSVATQDGLAILRDTLSDLAFTRTGRWFKCDLRHDHVLVRLNYRDQGRERTERSTRAKLSILTDAITMERSAFIERLRKFLNQNGFEL